MTGQPDQLTLVFDAGSSSRQNLEDMQHFVTAVKPSSHLALLEEAAGDLSGVQLSSGATVPAWRTSRVLAGKRREVVVVFSARLHAGQLRGLHQTLLKTWHEFDEMGSFARATTETAQRKLEKLRKRQYLRSLFGYRIDQDEQGPIRVSVWSDWLEYQRLNQRYFGLRVLITDRAEWTTAQIIEAYRGQSKVEAAFRDLKNPHMLATRPQFHWTDQKLHVHAFICVMAYLLITLLHRRAKQNVAFDGSPRRLLAELAEVRCCRSIDMTGRKGRPRVRLQIEEINAELRTLAESVEAIPALR